MTSESLSKGPGDAKIAGKGEEALGLQPPSTNTVSANTPQGKNKAPSTASSQSLDPSRSGSPVPRPVRLRKNPTRPRTPAPQPLLRLAHSLSQSLHIATTYYRTLAKPVQAALAIAAVTCAWIPLLIGSLLCVFLLPLVPLLVLGYVLVYDAPALVADAHAATCFLLQRQTPLPGYITLHSTLSFFDTLARVLLHLAWRAVAYVMGALVRVFVVRPLRGSASLVWKLTRTIYPPPRRTSMPTPRRLSLRH